MYVLLGSHVNALRWLVEDQNPRLCHQPFRQNDFLLVTTTQVTDFPIKLGRLDLEVMDETMCGAPLSRLI
jgi:hypothetical protein